MSERPAPSAPVSAIDVEALRDIPAPETFADTLANWYDQMWGPHGIGTLGSSWDKATVTYAERALRALPALLVAVEERDRLREREREWREYYHRDVSPIEAYERVVDELERLREERDRLREDNRRLREQTLDIDHLRFRSRMLAYIEGEAKRDISRSPRFMLDDARRAALDEKEGTDAHESA